MSDKMIGLGTFHHYARLGGFEGPAIDEMALFDAANSNTADISPAVPPAEDVYPSYFIDELGAIPEPEWLVREVLSETTVAMFYGASGSLKTFAVLDLALSAVYRGAWAEGKSDGLSGFKIKRPLRVGIIAGEGARGLRKRIRAWQRRHAMTKDDHSLAVFPQMPTFKNDLHVAKLIKSVRQKLQTVDLLIVDTVMRAATGFNLSIPSDSQAFLDICNRIGQELNCTMLLVHHTGKNAAMGPLGAENLKAYVDSVECVTQIEQSKNRRVIEIRQEKAKDSEPRDPIYMLASVEELGVDAEGLPLVSFVLARVAKPASAKGGNPDQIRTTLAVGIIRDASSEGHKLNKRQLAEKLIIAERGAIAEGDGGARQIASTAKWLNTQAKERLKGYAQQVGIRKKARWEFFDQGLLGMAGQK